MKGRRIAVVLALVSFTGPPTVRGADDAGDMKMTVRDGVLIVRSKRFTAEFRDGVLRRLTDRPSGTEFLPPPPPAKAKPDSAPEPFPVELHYQDKSTLGLDADGKVRTKLLSDRAARIAFGGRGADRELLLRLDEGTGDLCVRPGGQSVRAGLLAARWNVTFAPEAVFVLPVDGGRTFRAGMRVQMQDRNPWPSRWNAQLAIVQRPKASLMVHSEDTRYRYKALTVRRDGPRVSLGFESENTGPVAGKRTAGGVTWRINTYPGSWRAPADRYRTWMEKTYDLKAKRARRPAWAKEVTLAVCWVGNDPRLLAPLAKINPPAKTLIHQDRWRKDPYDVNYPDYTPSAEGRAFIQKALDMGFRVLPHANYFACWNRHPLFARIKAWQARDVFTGEPIYWRPGARGKAHMAYIHPGLGLWRRTLIDNVVAACRDLKVPGVLLDQTYHAWNTQNGVVEGATMVEGLHRLQEEFAAAAPDLVIAGENLTEISFQRQAFAQLHLPGWRSPDQSHLKTSHPICSYLWQGHSRYIGYLGVEPTNRGLAMAVATYRRLGVLPSLIARGHVAANPQLIAPDSPAMKIIRDWIRDGIRYEK